MNVLMILCGVLAAAAASMTARDQEPRVAGYTGTGGAVETLTGVLRIVWIYHLSTEKLSARTGERSNSNI